MSNTAKLHRLLDQEPFIKAKQAFAGSSPMHGHPVRASRVKELVNQSPGMSDANKRMIIDALDLYLVENDRIESFRLGLFMAVLVECVPAAEYRPLRWALTDQSKNPIIEKDGTTLQ